MKLNTLRSIVLIAIGASASICHAWESSKNTLWLNAGIQTKITEKLSIKINQEVRIYERGLDYYYRHTEASLKWQFLPDWSIAPAFRYATDSATSTSISTSIWHLNVANKTSIAGIDLKTRARIFYTDLHDTSNRIDFRPKLTATPSNGWTAWDLKPYLADEIMLNINDGGEFYRNRFSIGLTCKPLKRVSLSSFIMHDRYESSSIWRERYHYGLSAGLSF